MALQNVLIRPRLLEQRIYTGENTYWDLLMDLGSRLLRDVAEGGAVKSKIEQALNAQFAQHQQDFEQRLSASGDALLEWLSPFTSPFQALGNQTNPIAVAGQLLNLLKSLLDNLTVDAIEQKLLALVDIVENVMGFTVERVTAMLAGLIDAVVDALTADYLGGDFSEAATRSFVIGNSIERLRDGIMRRFRNEGINFDLRALIQAWMNSIRNTGLDEALAGVRDFIARIESMVSGSASVMGILNGQLVGNAKVGGPNDPVSWYASWFKGEIIGVADRFDLSGEAFVNEMRLEPVSLNVLENIAHIGSILTDLAEVILHLRSVEKGDAAANSVNAILQAFKMIVSLSIHNSTDQGWVDAYKAIGNWWCEYLVSIGISFFSSLESAFLSGPQPGGCARFIFYLTLLGKDVVELLSYSNWAKLLPDFVLSILTLINADPTAQPGSKNQDKVEGIAIALGEIATRISLEIGSWNDYGFPLRSGVAGFIGRWGAGIGMSWGGAILGWFASAALARTWPSGDSFGSITWQSLLRGLLEWPVYSYYRWDGDTANGTRGRDSANRLVTFRGYPERESSPYRMPYEAGGVFQCAQGNMGVWSHNAGTDRVYAFDFALDHDHEVLAMRGGTVMSYLDELGNHNTIRDNRLLIRHDDPSESILPNPVHDLDHTGAVTTRGMYAHGAQACVRRAFALRGVPESRIVNTPVERGMLLMYSGDTGTSAYNHLHVDVESAICTTLPFAFGDIVGGVPKALTWYGSQNQRVPDPVGLPVIHPDYHRSAMAHHGALLDTFSNKDITILFFGAGEYGYDEYFNNCYVHVPETTVFNQILEYSYDGTNGVGRAKLSQNWDPIHPIGTQFDIVAYSGASTSNTLVLDARASSWDDEYKDRHIFVKWKRTDGTEARVIRKITGYAGGDHKVTIQGTWPENPSVGSEFAIGAKHYPQASGFEKKFAYVASYNFDVNNPNLYELARVGEVGADHPADRWLRTAAYAEHLITNPIAANIVKGNATVDLGVNASNVNDAYKDRFIVITSNDLMTGDTIEMFQYRKISAYDGTTKIATVSVAWDTDIATVTPFHITKYSIGRPDFTHASTEEKQKYAFYRPYNFHVGDLQPFDPARVQDFLNGVRPYQYLTYKARW